MTPVTLTIVLCAVVFQTCTQFTNAEIASCRKPSKTGCGSVIEFTSPLDPDTTFYGYKFSDSEKEGTCSRANVQYANKPTAHLQDDTVDSCTCENTACSTCIKDKTKADMDSCCGLVKYPYFGHTYYLVDENKTKPECCAAEGIDSNNDPVTECYCDAGTEGCFNLCPEPVTSRIVGGMHIESCGTQVVRFVNERGGHVLCNAIHMYNPKGIDSKGKKLDTMTMVLAPKVCLEGLNYLKDQIVVTIGNTSFPLKTGDYTRIKLKNTFSDGLIFNSYTGPCFDKPVCTYDKDTMAASIDKQRCYMLSYGADKQVGGYQPEYSGNLSTLPIFETGSIGMCSNPVEKVDPECFFPANIAARYYIGDIGAPIFCMLKTGEEVLYGTFGQNTVGGGVLIPVKPIN